VIDERSAGYWAAAAEHVLALARCSDCLRYVVPPDIVCPHCQSSDPRFVFVPVSGRGVIRSWTVLHDSFLPGFDDDLPFVLVDVELAEQPDLRVIGRLVDGPEAVWHLGDPVSVAFEDLSESVSVPAFALERPTGRRARR
jgi:uncharacterized OB-fold protein